MEVTREQIIKLLTEEMEKLKPKILETAEYATCYYENWDPEHDHYTWNKMADDSMMYQRRYIATKYTKKFITENYPKGYKFKIFTSNTKELITEVVNCYGSEEGEDAEVTWDMINPKFDEIFD